MAAGKKSHEVVESGSSGKPHCSVGSSDGGSVCFSDAEESWHSPCGSNPRGAGSSDEFGLSGASDHEIRSSSNSSVSDFCSDVDLESGVSEIKVHSAKAEKDCRICHMSLESGNQESGIPIELGCSCKDDLAAAHKQCAEAWFKIRGNKTCEICGAIARNVVGATEPVFTEQWNETGTAITVTETRSFWRGHRFLNFLLACMVFAFVISWLFHFNVPSS